MAVAATPPSPHLKACHRSVGLNQATEASLSPHGDGASPLRYAASTAWIRFSALAWADVLLTRDTGDFAEILGGSFYELLVLTPGDFLQPSAERDGYPKKSS